MNIILQYALITAAAFLVGGLLGVLAALWQRTTLEKLVEDTLKDDSKAFDFVRISGAIAVFVYLGGWVVAVFHDYMVMVNHATDFGLGLAAVLGAYAGSVVGHSFAKK